MLSSLGTGRQRLPPMVRDRRQAGLQGIRWKRWVRIRQGQQHIVYIQGLIAGNELHVWMIDWVR